MVIVRNVFVPPGETGKQTQEQKNTLQAQIGFVGFARDIRQKHETQAQHTTRQAHTKQNAPAQQDMRELIDY